MPGFIFDLFDRYSNPNPDEIRSNGNRLNRIYVIFFISTKVLVISFLYGNCGGYRYGFSVSTMRAELNIYLIDI